MIVNLCLYIRFTSAFMKKIIEKIQGFDIVLKHLKYRISETWFYHCILLAILLQAYLLYYGDLRQPCLLYI